MIPRKRRLLSLLSGLLAVTAFFLLSSVAVVWANGLKFNPEVKRFEKTVVVAIESKDTHRPVAVYLNDELIATEIPMRLRGLLPGRYEIRIEQDGFHTHSQVFRLRAGEVKAIRDYRPIAVSPKVTLEPNRTVYPEPLFEAGLRVTPDGELIDRDTLVTRLIVTPLTVRRIGTGYLYQIGNELRLFLPEGPHDYFIYRLATDQPVQMNVRSALWQIFLGEDASTKLVELTNPS